MTKIKLKYTKGTFQRATKPFTPDETIECHTVSDGTITAHADSHAKAMSLYHVHVFAQPAQDYKPYKPGTGSWL